MNSVILFVFLSSLVFSPRVLPAPPLASYHVPTKNRFRLLCLCFIALLQVMWELLRVRYFFGFAFWVPISMLYSIPPRPPVFRTPSCKFYHFFPQDRDCDMWYDEFWKCARFRIPPIDWDKFSLLYWQGQWATSCAQRCTWQIEAGVRCPDQRVARIPPSNSGYKWGRWNEASRWSGVLGTWAPHFTLLP